MEVKDEWKWYCLTSTVSWINFDGDTITRDVIKCIRAPNLETANRVEMGRAEEIAKIPTFTSNTWEEEKRQKLQESAVRARKDGLDVKDLTWPELPSIAETKLFFVQGKGGEICNDGVYNCVIWSDTAEAAIAGAYRNYFFHVDVTAVPWTEDVHPSATPNYFLKKQLAATMSALNECDAYLQKLQTEIDKLDATKQQAQTCREKLTVHAQQLEELIHSKSVVS